MTGSRRYDEDEVAEIFERATRESPVDPQPGSGPPSEDGMTLAELEEIGVEVGIPREQIAMAARSLRHSVHAAPPERFLGATRSVSRTLHIERALTDAEWERLVADLRRTFDAKGKVEVQGRLRSWTNGNLQLHVEPEDSGYTVRMRTRKGQTTQFLMMGSIFTGMGALIATGILSTSGDPLSKGMLLIMLGLGLLGWARLSLPAWARTRAEQMEGLAERIPRLMGE